MRRILLFTFVLSFLYCNPTKTVYVNNVNGLDTEAFKPFNKGVHYENGYSLTVYKDLILYDGKNYYQLKLSYTDDEYVLADSVKDTQPLIYLTVNNIQGENLYREEDLRNVIKILPFGYRVLFKSKFKKNWEDIYLVEYTDSSFGYMKSENLKTQSESEYFKVATTLGLILREKPDQKSKQLDIIPLNYIGEVKTKDNTVLTIAGRKGNWILTDYNGKQGWVFSGFVYLSKYNGHLANNYSIEEKFYSLFEKVTELKSFPIVKKQIEKDFKEKEIPLIGDYSLRSIFYTARGTEYNECKENSNSQSILNNAKNLEYEEIFAREEYEIFFKNKLFITDYTTCHCCCSSGGMRFYFLLKNKVLVYDSSHSSYNFYWSADEKCNLNFEKMKYSEKDSTLYLYSLFPDCSVKRDPDYPYDSIVKFKDYAKELFIAVKILEDDIVIKRFFDKSIPKEYLKSYEEAEQIK